ncbi:hypothetical protein LPJ75_004005 [Coemansia sp. RSA 2598]|nr:hypothetical protein LPJ75_004005 [Coemansia sp. RSA 2598]
MAAGKKAAPQHSADALEDDFAIDPDYISDANDDRYSNDEGSAEEETLQKQKAQASKKRGSKQSETEQPSFKKSKTQPAATNKPAKQGKIQKFAVPRALDEQADLWNRCMQKAYPGITQLELEDIKMLPKHMYKTENEPSWESESYLEDLVKTAVSSGKAKNKVMLGAPQVLVICSSALRVIDLVKKLRPISPKRPVMKLFSRHIKIDDHKKLLGKTAVDVAVGTPNRILRLLADKDLKINRLRLVVIDCWQDNKMRVVVDMDDTREDLYRIWRDELLPASANADYGFRFRLA